ncbi:MAG: hypothetical protein M0P09_01240 [Acholeplasmataceae bacterium]|nr:hypothetical protein [Acholeplasmataceae bacterium]
MYTRETQIINMIVQIPNSVQPINGLSVVLTAADIITTPDGQQVGYPYQRQQYLIPSDMTSDLVTALNGSLASVGYKLVPIAEE